MTTFILRVAGEAGGSLRGTVTHAATGETRTFVETVQLLAYIQEWRAAAGIRATAAEWQTLGGPDGGKGGRGSRRDDRPIGTERP